MEEADTDGEVVDATEGVTLRKRYEEAEFHQPAVVYELTSDRDDRVRVRVIESIPDALAPEDLGFLGSSMERTWQIKGPKLVFENVLEPNESFTTACAARGDTADAITDLLGHPEAFEASPVESADREAAAPFTRSAANADPPADAGPAAEAEAEAEDRERVVEQLVAELRTGQVSEESVTFLREELGAGRPPRSVEARLKQLQTDLADVRAYTNALEAFIDEHGSGDEIVDRLERRLASLEAAIEEVEESADGHGDHLDRLQADVDDLDAEVDALSREFGDVADQVAGLRADLEAVEDRLPDYDIDERIEELDAELSDVVRFTNTLRAAFEE